MYVKDVLEAVAEFDAEEVGAYCLLLFHQWERGRLPLDPRSLPRLAHVEPDRWERVWTVIGGKFKRDKKGLFNGRLDSIRRAQDQKAQLWQEFGRKGAEKRWNSQANSQANGVAITSASISTSTSPSSSKSVRGGGRGAEATGFDAFWSTYPRKVGKAKARNAWENTRQARPPLEVLLDKLEALKASEQWSKEGGQYIPHPATWLNRGGWDDEPENAKPEARLSPGLTQRQLDDFGELKFTTRDEEAS